MATWQYSLGEPPDEPRARELWLQHAAGFILFEDVRRFALEQIDPALPAETRAAVEKGINDAVYGLMMVIDGVTGGIWNDKATLSLNCMVRLAQRNDLEENRVISELDLSKGDGMCLGFHGWCQGDFGKHPIAVTNLGSDPQQVPIPQSADGILPDEGS